MMLRFPPLWLVLFVLALVRVEVGVSVGMFNADGTSLVVQNFTNPEESNNSWCVARYGTDAVGLQAALDWACGPGSADCEAIQLGGSCYAPNTLFAHASFAFNNYYQKNFRAPGSCDFQGAAMLIYVDPSYRGCPYASRGGEVTEDDDMSGEVRAQARAWWIVTLFLYSWVAITLFW